MQFAVHRKNQLALAAAGVVAGATVIALRALVRTLAHGSQALTLRAEVRVKRSPEDVYRFWRHFQNLSGLLRHFESVGEIDGTTVWTARLPTGRELRWDAEIVADRRNERIAWRSLEGAILPNHGSVTFKPAGGGLVTELNVELGFEPPPGPLGNVLARAFGATPARDLRQDLRRLKRLLEAEHDQVAATGTPRVSQVATTGGRDSRMVS